MPAAPRGERGQGGGAGTGGGTEEGGRGGRPSRIREGREKDEGEGTGGGGRWRRPGPSHAQQTSSTRNMYERYILREAICARAIFSPDANDL
eukprot:3090522-Pyramimonas_sp.AAC.1